jgi:polyisoprenyl-teichoic acid--peptidoglycan teichoic acid transferase
MPPARYYTVKTKRRKLKKGRLLFLLALLAFLSTLFVSIRFLSALNATQDQSAWAVGLPKPPKNAPENLLLYSVSDTEGGTVTCLVLAAYDKNEGTFNAVNIPADTLVDVEGYGFMRLAHTYGVGEREVLLNSVSALLGLPIHTYLEINEVFLPAALDHINTSSLLQSLEITNGGDILSVIHANGLTPAENLEQRRRILGAISAEVLDAGVISKLRIYHRLSPLIQTNLPWRTFLSRLDNFKSTAYPDVVTIALLPGRQDVQSDGSYWLPNTDEIAHISVWLENPQAQVPKSQIQVEVLNGSGITGVANDLAQKLRNEGYNVILVGNADHHNYDISQVISRVEDMDAAKDIAILVVNAQLLKEEVPDNDAHVTVIIGKNYKR